MDLTRSEFERVVHEAFESLPDRFKDRIENVVIALEDEPADADLAGATHPGRNFELLGLYRGVALTERGVTGGPLLPDEIAIFRGPINRVASSHAEAVRQVRKTLLHEFGHYFGLHDDEMPG